MRTQTTSSCLIVQGDSIVLCRHLAGGYYFLPDGDHIGRVITKRYYDEGNKLIITENGIAHG